MRSFHFFDRPRIRRLVHRKLANWLIPILWGAGLATLYEAATLESSHLPIWPAIVLSYLIFAAATIWSLGCWFASDMVVKRNPMFWTRTKKRSATGNVWLRYRLIKYVGALALGLVFVIPLLATYEINYRLELTRLKGFLFPASDPTPITSCGAIEPGQVVLIYGDNAAVVGRFPHVILRSVALGPVISLDRLSDGSIVVLMDIKDSDGKLIVRLDKKGFFANEHTILGPPSRPNRSTLIITDEYGVEALNIRFLNPQAIKVDGSFHYPGRRAAIPLQLRTLHDVCTKGTDNTPADVLID